MAFAEKGRLDSNAHEAMAPPPMNLGPSQHKPVMLEHQGAGIPNIPLPPPLQQPPFEMPPAWGHPLAGNGMHIPFPHHLAAFPPTSGPGALSAGLVSGDAANSGLMSAMAASGADSSSLRLGIPLSEGTFESLLSAFHTTGPFRLWLAYRRTTRHSKNKK